MIFIVICLVLLIVAIAFVAIEDRDQRQAWEQQDAQRESEQRLIDLEFEAARDQNRRAA